LLRGINEKPVNAIQQAVELLGISQVCVGRGRGTYFKQFFLGSVSQSVVESVDCTVFITKIPTDEITDEMVKLRIGQMPLDKIFTTEKISEHHPFAQYQFTFSQTDILEKLNLDEKIEKASKEYEVDQDYERSHLIWQEERKKRTKN